MKIEDDVYDVATAYQRDKKQSPKVTPTKKKKVKGDDEDEDEEYKPPNYVKKAKKAKRLKTSKADSPKAKKQEHKVFTCRRCLAEFNSRKGLTDHTKLYHNNDTKEEHTFRYDEDQDLYTCTTCSAEYQTKEKWKSTSPRCTRSSIRVSSATILLLRLIPVLCVTIILQEEPACRTTSNRVHYHKFYYTCHTCGKGFNDPAIYKEHNNEHLGIKPFICVVCNKDFVYSRYLLIHQTKYHTVHIEGTLHKTQCSICLKVFSKISTLLKHITTKHGQCKEEKVEKRHLCDMCGKGFGTSDKLRYITESTQETSLSCAGTGEKTVLEERLFGHARTGAYWREAIPMAYDYGAHAHTHRADKMFPCPMCPYKTMRRTSLMVHINYLHLKKFAYFCETCGKGFNDALLAKEHHNEHLGIKPFVCVVRSHRVGIEGQLLPNQCFYCSKVFSKMETLEKHHKQRHLSTTPHEKKHLCDSCGKGFSQKNKLQIHYSAFTAGRSPTAAGSAANASAKGPPKDPFADAYWRAPLCLLVCSTGFTSKGALTMHCKNCNG
nr:unnamed protein product [Callosobruchus analis]